jgi:hypothetical protein
MRIVFSVLSLLVVVAVIGILAKKQLGGPAPVVIPASAGAPSGPVLTGTPQQQVQQFRQAAEKALQQPRPTPDDQ